MQEFRLTIEGRTPLLCNRFGDDAQMKASSGQSTVQVGDKGTPREQAEKRLYLGTDGTTPIIPSPNLLRCIIDAGKFFKAGKSKITTQKTSLIPACVSIAELELPIAHPEPWMVDTRAVRIPSTGGRIQCHRPCFTDWKLTCTVELDEELLSEKTLFDIIEAAGKRVGLGDFRPDCKGPFGRFRVVEWAKLSAVAAA